MTVMRTDDYTLEAVAGWAESVARSMREAADRLDDVAARARYADNVGQEGRYVATIIRARVLGVAVTAYDVQSCEVCHEPAQWHDHARTDHYPQAWVIA